MSLDGERPSPPPRRTMRTSRLDLWLRRSATAIVSPVRAVRAAQAPVLIVYLASGALGLVAVADGFWVKTSLSLSPAELATLGVWLQLPWTVKIVFSGLVDSVPLLGSRRRSYLLLGAGAMAAGLLLLWGAASGRISFASPASVYVLAQLLIVVGSVLQEVVADAMSAEVVGQTDRDGRPRPDGEVEAELAMVQVLARLAYTIGALSVGWLAGVLAGSLSYATVFLIGLAIPALSAVGALLAREQAVAARPIDLRLLMAGVAFASVAAMIALSGFALGVELIFVLALMVLVALSRRALAKLPPLDRHRIVATAVAVFAFRAAPTPGDGYRWFAIDRLGFDEHFFGVLQVSGTAVGLVLMWLLADALVRRQVRPLILLLTAVAAALWLPSLGLACGVHQWTAALGIGPRQIALIDEAAQSPLALLATVPLMALVAAQAPATQRATWLALAASLMSLAIVASQLLTKHLNQLFPVDRGAYDTLPQLVLAVVVLSVLMPVTAILLLGRRLDSTR